MPDTLPLGDLRHVDAAASQLLGDLRHRQVEAFEQDCLDPLAKLGGFARMWLVQPP